MYGREYFDNYEPPYTDRNCWLYWFDHIAYNIVKAVNPGNVLDVGCAFGYLVERLRDRGIDAYGVDASPYAISQAHGKIRPFLRVASGADEIAGRYDLVTCIEVAEHMPEADAVKMIHNISVSTDMVLFSSTMDDDREEHVNMHPLEYWQEQFSRCGFCRAAPAPFLTPHALWIAK